jgi:sulfur relay (sulfurtransferase) complex TusBCD TusD component (DsrE family)
VAWSALGWDIDGVGANVTYGQAAIEWARRGAINAGLSVFLYLDSVMKGAVTIQPSYDHCEELGP